WFDVRAWLDSHWCQLQQKDTMTRKLSVVVLLATSLLGFCHPSLSEQRPQPHECYADSVSQCYRQYHGVLWGEMGGNHDRVCKNVTAKFPCHQRIASCPEPVRTNFSRQEEGYEALRNFVCDRKAFHGEKG
ncbi:hypothetical protein MTO96_035417, partial [Rhipicephalus appendiculatus]